MKRTALLLLALALPLAARADDASHRAKAKEMLTVLHVDRIVDSIVANINGQVMTITRRLAPATTTPAQNAAIDTFHSKVLALVKTQVNWATLEPVYLDLYARTFTDEELDGILAFYKTPSGKALLEKSPTLTVDAQKIPQQKLVDMQPQLTQYVQEFQKAMTAPAPSPAPAAKP